MSSNTTTQRLQRSQTVLMWVSRIKCLVFNSLSVIHVGIAHVESRSYVASILDAMLSQHAESRSYGSFKHLYDAKPGSVLVFSLSDVVG